MGRCEGSAVRAVPSAKLYLYCELSKRKGRVAGVGTNGECLAGGCPYISLHVKWATRLSSGGNREASGRLSSLYIIIRCHPCPLISNF